MSLLYRPPAWTNAHLTLFHGTVETAVNSILDGIDLGRCRPYRDFGRGFYTTTLRRQAEYWAQVEAGKSATPTAPVVVAFAVDLHRLARLETLVFVRGEFEADAFWSLVYRCREYDSDHGRTTNGGWYDLVAGPVSSFWEQRTAVPGYDQFSFHTPLGVLLLDASSPHVVT